MEELKPCPFCGSHDVKVAHDCHVCDGEEYASVKCDGCGAFVMALGQGSTPDEAENDARVKWNRRADECDRDALSKLADEFAWWGKDCFKRDYPVRVSIGWMVEQADRIRKAIGEE